jgi:hypothetical protein
LTAVGVRVALAVFVVLVLGASCDGGDPSPTTLPSSAPPSVVTTTAAPPSTPTPTPTPTPPTLPAAARADSPAGAEAFARFWLTTLDYAYKTGDTKPFRALGSCDGCKTLADSIDKLFRGGGNVSGGNLVVIETRLDRHVPRKAAAVELFYSRTRRVVDDGKGGHFVDPAAKRLGFFLVLARKTQGWLVTEFPVIDR